MGFVQAVGPCRLALAPPRNYDHPSVETRTPSVETMKPMKDREIAEFRERLQFLEMAWECRTEYELNLSTGRGSLRITPAAGEVALFLGDIDFRQIGLPTPDRGNDDPDHGNP